MTTHFDFTNERGVPFRVVLLAAGETNPNYPAATAGEPVVEFYDRRYQHTPDGQFTGARYYLRTLTADGRRHNAVGLDLHGGVDSWQMDGETYNRAVVGVLSKAFIAACLQEA
jgi:hypothetical protein